MGRKKKSTISTIITNKKSQQNSRNVEEMKPKFRSVDILSRLNKSFINIADYCNEENAIEYNFKPRRIFINGLCLRCLECCNHKIVCDTCKMVSYCSEKHRKEDYDDHKVLCSNLRDLYRTGNGLQMESSVKTPDEYRLFRVKMIESIELRMKRRLDLWEKEIILYPRICRICYQYYDKNCPQCGIDVLCSNPNDSQEHLQWCSKFQVFKRVAQLQRKYGNCKPRLPNIVDNVAYELPKCFDDVLGHVIGGTKLYDDLDIYNYVMLSHLSSIPLTILYAFQRTYQKEWREKSSLTIHIIGAEFEFECANFKFWEAMFLHFLPSLKNLTLIIVGSELQAPQFLLDALKNIELCTKCGKKKSIKVEFHPLKLYHEVKSLPRPDVISLFNPGLYRTTGYSMSDTWPETIKCFCKYKVPVVVTSYTSYEIPKDVARIESVCPIKVLLEPEKNKFCSLKPDRNFVSDDVDPLIFKNYCIAIVQGI